VSILELFKSHKGLYHVDTLKKREFIIVNTLAVLIGIMGGYVAIILRYMIIFFQNIFFYGTFSFGETTILKHSLGPAVIFIPAIGGIFVGLLVYYGAQEAKGHGMPEVMEAILFKAGKIRPVVGVVKAVASAICIASGGSTGREGPIIQIGASLGSTLGQYFKFRPNLLKVLVGCGAAAGLAATFNTPIAGVIFTFEVVLFEFKTRSFIPIVISTVFATFISRYYLGDFPAFRVPKYSFVHPVEFGFYLLLGLLAGLLSVVVIKSLYGVEDFFDRLKVPEFIKPAIGGLVVGIMGFTHPEIFGIGYETVEKALNSSLPLKILLILILLKILSLSFTIGSGGSGGIFAPTLYIGAVLGGAFGEVMHHFFPHFTANSGAYALVGMAALFAGVSRATLTAIIILFEMTLNYKIILPLMFACVVADGVSWLLTDATIYTMKLKRKGFLLNLDMEVDPLELKRVEDVMNRNIIKVVSNDRVKDVFELMVESHHHGFPVVNRKGLLIGLITEDELLRDISRGKENIPVKDSIAAKLIVTYPDENLHRALHKMVLHHVDYLPVVSRKNPRKLLGIVSRSDILKILK